ncbi:MAG: DUF4251 domain-containing protein [Bacteroidetes bacterium]|nr:MAG: DUF4251 domain-containing protein [Bacteroidota bacterium]
MLLLHKSFKMRNANVTIKKIFCFIFLAGICSSGLRSQDKMGAIKNLVDSGEFIFHAQTAMPSSGPTKQLTSEYDVRVSKNSFVSHLPYFGRAYSAPYGSGDGGFNFTSKEFEYSSTTRKKGGWEITIKPKDVADVREFLLTVSENGYGTLQAMSNNRRPISFTGFVTEPKEPTDH